MRGKYFRTILLISAAMLLFATFNSSAQEKSSREQRKESRIMRQNEIRNLISGKTFIFFADAVHPSRGRPVILTRGEYYMRFSPEKIESRLPFFGTVYSGIGYGNDAGLHFTGTPGNYEIDMEKKGYQIKASVNPGTENFNISLTVSVDGTASLTVTGINRSTISYRGEISRE
jgi:hypothetical protein